MAPATACTTHRSSHVIICEPFTSPVLYGSAGWARERQPAEASFLILSEKAAWAGRGAESGGSVKDICRRKGLALVGRKKEGTAAVHKERIQGLWRPSSTHFCLILWAGAGDSRRHVPAVVDRSEWRLAGRLFVNSCFFLLKWGDACLQRVPSLLGQRRVTAEGRKSGCSAVDYLRDFSSLGRCGRMTIMRPATVTAGACKVPNERDVQVRRGKWQRWWGEQRSGRGFRSQARTGPWLMSAADKGAKIFLQLSLEISLRWKLSLLSISLFFLFPLLAPAFPSPFKIGRVHHDPGWGSSLCCSSGCDTARCGDNCASYCLASAGDDQLQMKIITTGIPFVFPGIIFEKDGNRTWLSFDSLIILSMCGFAGTVMKIQIFKNCLSGNIPGESC